MKHRSGQSRIDNPAQRRITHGEVEQYADEAPKRVATARATPLGGMRAHVHMQCMLQRCFAAMWGFAAATVGGDTNASVCSGASLRMSATVQQRQRTW